jgi:maleate isomerase
MYGKKGRIGLAVLDNDLCIEPDLRRILPDGVEIHAARVVYPHEVTPAAMAEATRGLELAVKSLVAVQPKSIVWSCTSGSFFNGKAGNDNLLRELAAVSGGIPVATASSALIAALNALGLKRPAVGTPYSPAINKVLGNFLRENGFDPLPVAGYFAELVDDDTLQALEEDEVAAFAREIDRPEADSVVISCTGLPTAGIVEMLEQELGKPVVTSNIAILWHALKIGGIPVKPPHRGRLFSA